jgi:hypothetical protein
MDARDRRFTSLTHPSGTVFWFGAYLALTGAVLFTVPGLFLSILQLPPPSDPWLRVLAVPLFNFGLMYTAMARWAPPAVLRMTALTRSWVVLAFGLLVVLDLAPPVLMLFAAADLAGAFWTFWALRREKAAPAGA